MSPKLVRKLLDYNPSSGRFTWRKRELRHGFERLDKGWNTRFAGKIVAERRHRHGHMQIGLFCKNYMAHRLAWMHFYGEIPSIGIDHKNCDPGDNRIENLRLASQSENMCNSVNRLDNTSGTKGVSWIKKEKKWHSYINKNGKMKSIGRFNKLEDAILARKNAEKIYHGEFARTT